jgi:hypothetical protein
LPRGFRRAGKRGGVFGTVRPCFRVGYRFRLRGFAYLRRLDRHCVTNRAVDSHNDIGAHDLGESVRFDVDPV